MSISFRNPSNYCKISFVIPDFEKEMVCKWPYEEIDGVGCLWVYVNYAHTFDEGKAKCMENGGDVFEFKNFDQEHEKVEKFLFSNQGSSLHLY